MERDQVEHYFARSVGTRLHYAELGSGPPVVLLHGIPESWEAWRRTMVLLADGGHRSIAADLRGYGLSDKPRNVAAYRAELLAVDVASIIRACGEQCATVVGHSWGGLTAWLFAMRFPEMLERLVILDAPHPLVWIGAMRSIGFWRRNPQMLVFQMPWIPEAMLRAGNFSALRRNVERELAWSDVPMETYLEGWRAPGAMKGALNYYRAMLRENPFRLRWPLQVIEAPVLVVWGKEDPYFPIEMATPPQRWVPHARVEFLNGAGHWPHHDRPSEWTGALAAFLQ